MKRFVMLLLMALLISPTLIHAQEETVQQLFIVDIVQNGAYRTPAHFGGRGNPADAELVGAHPAMLDYGLINVGLVAADVTATQQAYLATLTDVIIVPVNLDTSIDTSQQVTVVSDALESKGIPGTWVNVGDTYRTVLREVVGYFLFMQRLTTITGINPTTLNINLAVRYGQLPQVWQDAILQAGADLGYSTAGLTSNTTLRAILRSIAAQNDLKTFIIGSTIL